MATAKKITAAGGFQPTLVHAYRRKPHLELNTRTGLDEEKPVVVEFKGEKAVFQTNEQDHIVALVSSQALFDRLTKEIPEAYIPYDGGDNVPTERVLGAEHQGESVPDGKYVLRNGDEFVVLDDMSDDDVRVFAIDTAGIESDALPAALAGDTLKLAVFNQLKAI